MTYAEQAVAGGSNNFACHKWMGILITYSSEFEGYKRKIERSFEIRDCFVVSQERLPCGGYFRESKHFANSPDTLAFSFHEYMYVI